MQREVLGRERGIRIGNPSVALLVCNRERLQKCDVPRGSVCGEGIPDLRFSARRSTLHRLLEYPPCVADDSAGVAGDFG